MVLSMSNSASEPMLSGGGVRGSGRESIQDEYERERDVCLPGVQAPTAHEAPDEHQPPREAAFREDEGADERSETAARSADHQRHREGDCMISVKVARKLRAQIRELRERKDVRAAALAVQKFVTTYDEAPTVTPYAGDFRIGSQGRVSLREAKRRGESEREALRAEATRLHRILDRALLKMAERGRKALGRPGVRTVEVEGYGRSREALKRIYPGGSPYPLHLAAGAKVSGIADAQLEAAALLMAEVIETMSERHDQDMTEGRKEIDDPAPGMDGGD